MTVANGVRAEEQGKRQTSRDNPQRMHMIMARCTSAKLYIFGCLYVRSCLLAQLHNASSYRASESIGSEKNIFI